MGLLFVCIILREYPKAQPKVVLEKPGIENITIHWNRKIRYEALLDSGYLMM